MLEPHDRGDNVRVQAISRKDLAPARNPQRLYARPSDGMRQSDLHGDVQSAAEMTAPASCVEASNKTERS